MDAEMHRCWSNDASASVQVCGRLLSYVSQGALVELCEVGEAAAVQDALFCGHNGEPSPDCDMPAMSVAASRGHHDVPGHPY